MFRIIALLVLFVFTSAPQGHASFIIDVYREINGDDSMAGYREFHHSVDVNPDLHFEPMLQYVNPDPFTGAGDTIKPDGIPDALSFRVVDYSRADQPDYGFVFTAPPGNNLELVKYEGASDLNLFHQFRNGPGLFLYNSGHADSGQFGSFEMLNLQYSQHSGNSFQIDSVGVNFDMNLGSDDRLYGRILYNVSPGEGGPNPGTPGSEGGVPVSAVPEPATLSLFGMGMAGFLLRRRQS